MKKQFKCIKQFCDIDVWEIWVFYMWTPWTFYDFNPLIWTATYKKFVDSREVEFLTEYFQEIKEEPKIDFSKWIGRSWDIL